METSNLHSVRMSARAKGADVRMELAPGERFGIRLGYIGVLLYQGQPRKLYAF